jgi:hypothetical protein
VLQSAEERTLGDAETARSGHIEDAGAVVFDDGVAETGNGVVERGGVDSIAGSSPGSSAGVSRRERGDQNCARFTPLTRPRTRRAATLSRRERGDRFAVRACIFVGEDLDDLDRVRGARIGYRFEVAAEAGRAIDGERLAAGVQA